MYNITGDEINMMIQFSIPIEPIPQARPRFGQGRAYEPKRCTAYKAQIKNAGRAAMDGNPPMTGEIHCSIRLYRKYKSTSRRFGDLDNLLKSILDGLNGITFVDDSQVVKCTIEKHTAPIPHVDITLSDEMTAQN